MKGTSLLVLLLLCACAGAEKKNTHPVHGRIEARMWKFQQCYHESDSYGMQKAGQVVTEFSVDRDGKVQDERIKESAFKDANFHACLLEQLRKTKFEAASQSVIRTFNFTPVLDENI